MVGYLALGSNLGDRWRALALATRSLAERVEVQAASAVYETIPEGNAPQPLYLNAAVRIATDLPPLELLDACLGIEKAHGRTRNPQENKGPRTIDIDVLLYGQFRLSEGRLVLPHPGLAVRPFVRIPLADVAEPGLRHPVTGERLDVAVPDGGVRRVEGVIPLP